MVRVWEVLADTEREGPAGDGTEVFRFRSQREADAFAAKNTCWGRACTVSDVEVPRATAARWGMA